MLRSIAVVMALCFATMTAQAATVDQSVPITEPLQSAGIYTYQWAAQTFEVGTTGRLDSLNLVLYLTGEIDVEIRKFSLIAPSYPDCPIGCLAPDFSASGLVASRHLLGDMGSPDTWVNISFGIDGPLLEAGDLLAIVLRTTTESNINWRNTNNPNGGSVDAYIRGQAYAANDTAMASNRWQSLGRADFNFETYMSSVVPIPPAVWLFGSALGLMGVMRRKAAA